MPFEGARFMINKGYIEKNSIKNVVKSEIK